MTGKESAVNVGGDNEPPSGTLHCASCGEPLRYEDARAKDNTLVHHLCPPPCTGYRNGCHCDDCTWSDMGDPRSNGFITWGEA